MRKQVSTGGGRGGGGRHEKFYPILRGGGGGGEKSFGPVVFPFSHFVDLLPITNDQSLNLNTMMSENTAQTEPQTG